MFRYPASADTSASPSFSLWGGVTHAQAPPQLPSGLKTGLNISSVYGGNNHRFAYGTPTTQLNDAYDMTHMEVMLDDSSHSDFSDIAKAGFGHIRLILDPVALGLLGGGTPSSPMRDEPLYQVRTDTAFWQILFTDIREAQEAGLMVILDFHPGIVSQPHWGRAIEKITSSTFRQGISGANWAITHPYPGTYKWRFLSGDGTANDPLAIFWSSFITQFVAKKAQFNATYANPNTVAFEVLNEPFEDCWPGMANVDGTDTEQTVGIPTYRPMIDPGQTTGWMNRYRASCRAAVRAIQNQVTGYRIIVSPPAQHPLTTHHVDTSVYKKVPDFVREEELIYAWHFYDPLQFTHRDTAANTYDYGRDWLGVTTPIYDVDGISPIATPRPRPGIQTVGETTTDVESFLVNAENELGYPPPVLISEFGAQVNAGPILLDPDPPGAGWPSLDNHPDEIPPSPALIQRSQWIWDAKTWIKTNLNNAGWSVFAYIGAGFPTYNGQMYSSAGYNFHGDRGVIPQITSQALFSNVRPN